MACFIFLVFARDWNTQLGHKERRASAHVLALIFLVNVTIPLLIRNKGFCGIFQPYIWFNAGHANFFVVVIM